MARPNERISMTNNRSISEIDFQLLEKHIGQVEAKFQDRSRSRSFLRAAIAYHRDIELGDADECITDDTGDKGIDAVHIERADSYADIYLFQSKYRTNRANCGKPIPESEAHKFGTFFQELMDKSLDLSLVAPKLAEYVKAIWSLFNSAVQCHFYYVLCTNGQGLQQQSVTHIENLVDRNKCLSLDQFLAPDFLSIITMKSRRLETGQISALGREWLQRGDGDIRGVLACVDAKSFVEMITDDEGQRIKRHLFDENIRSYLGPKGGYNQEIINSAISNDNHLFWYLNNGITIVCKKLAFNHTTNPLLKMSEYQIVNGAQTSYSLFRASQNPFADLSQITLLLRIYETERADISNKVAVATNSQARIMPRELRSNDNIQIKYEMLFLENDIVYERKKSLDTSDDGRLRIDALKCGQIIFAYFLMEPEKARRESDSIFEQRYEYIFRDTWDFEELVWAVRLYDRLENLRVSQEKKPPSERDKNLSVLIFGGWFTMFTIKLLIMRERVSAKKLQSGKVEELIQLAVRTINDVLVRNPAVSKYEFFRSKGMRDQVESEVLEAQGDLFFNLPPS